MATGPANIKILHDPADHIWREHSPICSQAESRSEVPLPLVPAFAVRVWFALLPPVGGAVGLGLVVCVLASTGFFGSSPRGSVKATGFAWHRRRG